jgi:hypothetical protein
MARRRSRTKSAKSGVVDADLRPSLALKTSESLRVFGEVVRQKLQGYEATQLHLLGFANVHATVQFFGDEVTRNATADEWRKVRPDAAMVVGNPSSSPRISGVLGRTHSPNPGKCLVVLVATCGQSLLTWLARHPGVGSWETARRTPRTQKE